MFKCLFDKKQYTKFYAENKEKALKDFQEKSRRDKLYELESEIQFYILNNYEIETGIRTGFIASFWHPEKIKNNCGTFETIFFYYKYKDKNYCYQYNNYRKRIYTHKDVLLTLTVEGSLLIKDFVLTDEKDMQEFCDLLDKIVKDYSKSLYKLENA